MAVNLQKTTEKHYEHYQKVVHMNGVLYSNSFEGPNRNVVICFTISRSVIHIFRLGHIVLGNIFNLLAAWIFFLFLFYCIKQGIIDDGPLNYYKNNAHPRCNGHSASRCSSVRLWNLGPQI